MPEMSGVEFLTEARKIFPHAKRTLLTAYADTDAAIHAINDADLDYYLQKPWDPPEENLYPVLDDLLSDWQADFAPYEGIEVLGTRWAPATHLAKDFLARNQIRYRFIDVETDSNALALVAQATEGSGEMPVLRFPDGTNLISPDFHQIAERVGLQTETDDPFYDMVVIGAGPAGLGAGVYGASEGLRAVLIESEAPGGQAGTSSRIENYLGFPSGISGGDLARRAVTQVQRLGAEILRATEAVSIRVVDDTIIVCLGDDTELICRALVIATGMEIRRLPAPGVDQLTGAGVYYGAAPAEAAAYEGENVLVIGGANSAGQAAMLLTRYAKSVTMLVRGEGLDDTMSAYLIDQLGAQPNFELRTHTEVVEAAGGEHLESVRVHHKDTGDETLDVSGMFIFIGSSPHSDIVKDLVELDEDGFVLTGPDLIRDGELPKSWPLDRQPLLMETSVPGIFAAGDIRSGVVRRVASAVGQGAVCVSIVHQYLATR
jgi:thioredoxin reductase (NADPH)